MFSNGKNRSKLCSVTLCNIACIGIINYWPDCRSEIAYINYINYYFSLKLLENFWVTFRRRSGKEEEIEVDENYLFFA